MNLFEPQLQVTIGNKIWQNPVSTASGTFGYGNEYMEYFDINQLGAIFTKAVTPLSRFGNPTPRIVETPSGILNAIGLTNEGVDKFIEKKIPFLQSLTTEVVVNVAGSTEEDYIAVVEKLEAIDGVDGYEINLSCPNVKSGCLSFGTDAYSVEQITKNLRKRTNRPLIIKLTPNVTDIASIAQAAERGGADAVSCINTLLGMVIDIKKKTTVLANKTGGLSGPAIKPVGVAAVYRVSRAVKIPVIGIGGINHGSDAVEYLLAGASAIQVGTGTFTNPLLSVEIIQFIKDYMIENKIEKISDFPKLLR